LQILDLISWRKGKGYRKNGDIWFMNFSLTGTGKNILAIVVGVLTTAAITTLCFFIATLLIAGDESPTKSQENISLFLMGFGLFAGSLIGGYITATASTQKNYIPVILTGIIVLAIIGLLGISDPSLFQNSDMLYGLIIILLVLIGGFIKLRKRKNSVDNLTFENEDTDADNSILK
jgi:predicted MFS family arabinose efflux permease